MYIPVAKGGQLPRQLLIFFITLSWPCDQLVQRAVFYVRAFLESPQDSGASQAEARDRIRVTSNLVILPVTVKDAAGNLVGGLQKSDFHVLDNGFEQKISVFTAEALPLSVVVLVDDDLPSEIAEQMVKGLRAVTGGFGPEDEAMVCRFDLFFYPGHGFVHDFDSIWNEVEEARSHSGPSTSGPVPFVTPPSTHALGVGEPAPAAATDLGHAPTKALDDAVYSAGELLRERARDRRKIILLISNGENGIQFNHHSYEDSLRILQAADASVFSLAVGSSGRKKGLLRLAHYANDSGGDIYYAAKSESMQKLYSQITEEARYEYTLAYVPTESSKSSDYHEVKVQIARPEVTVKTRPGYRITSH